MDGLQCLVTDQFYRKEAIPTPSEFEFFRLSQIIPAEFIKHTTDIMAARRLQIGDSVKIVTGEAQGAVGKVLNIHYAQASVHIPREDIQLFLPVDDLSRNIEIGDAVKVEMGVHKGISGWVTASEGDDLTIFEHHSAKQYEVSARYVTFFNAPFYQNWLHRESDTAPEEYHSILYNPKVDDPDLKPLLVSKPLIKDKDLEDSETESTPGPSRHMEIPMSTAPLTTSTPFPSSMPSWTPAWDPSSKTPDARSRFPSRPWMEHPLMEGKRVKVEIKNTTAHLSDPGWKSGGYEGRLGLWIGIRGKFARVRLGHDVLETPPQYVHPFMFPLSLDDTPEDDETRYQRAAVLAQPVEERTDHLCIVTEKLRRPVVLVICKLSGERTTATMPAQLQIPRPKARDRRGYPLLNIKKEDRIRRGTKVRVLYGSDVVDAVFVEHLWSLHAGMAYRREIRAQENTASTPKSVWVSKDVKVKLGDETTVVVSSRNCSKIPI
ncbi:hypothetical protein DXG01_001451 [Tephrocybe rancida]|nr:hypothetical protein DXG01_001451 [Tephrocybe rancida]